jgi:ElaB/YqjD/DUF883 family membrane-anchored ribosome-binding protein
MASTTDLRKTYTEAAKSLTGSKPFYAVAGAGDLAVEKLKAVPAKLRDEVTVSKIRSMPDRVRTELTAGDGAVKKVADKITDLPRDPRKLTDKLTDLADEQVKAADARFAKLATRGEKFVHKVRAENKDLIEKARKAAKKVRNLRGGEAAPAAPVAPVRRPAAKAAPAATPAEPKTTT